MPRPNQPRNLGSERALAHRVTALCAERGWKFPELAERMAAVGCPIQTSALYKMRDGDPPRRVTLDEAIAMANVFGVTVEELTMPKELLDQRQAAEIAQRIPGARERYEEAVIEALSLFLDYGRLAAESPELREFMDHQASAGWARLPAPRIVDLGETVTEEDAFAFALRVEHVWESITYLGRKAAGLEETAD